MSFFGMDCVRKKERGELSPDWSTSDLYLYFLKYENYETVNTSLKVCQLWQMHQAQHELERKKVQISFLFNSFILLVSLQGPFRSRTRAFDHIAWASSADLISQYVFIMLKVMKLFNFIINLVISKKHPWQLRKSICRGRLWLKAPEQRLKELMARLFMPVYFPNEMYLTCKTHNLQQNVLNNANLPQV